MKKNVIFLFLIILFNGIRVDAQQQKVRVAGSSTLNPITVDLGAAYIAKNTKFVISSTGGDSNDGYIALANGEADIAQMARKLYEEERIAFSRKGRNVIETPIAIDAIAVVVHKTNKISKLTREQLEDIYTGKVTNWKDVGGDDLKIILYSREKTGAVTQLFREKVLKGKDVSPKASLVTTFDEVDDRLDLFRGAIGFVTLSHVGARSKALSISFDGGKEYYEPNMENAKSEAYPIYRYLYYTYCDDASDAAKAFVKFALSGAGQFRVIKQGYAPAN